MKASRHVTEAVQVVRFAWNCMAWYGQLVVVFHWLTIRCRSARVEPGTR